MIASRHPIYARRPLLALALILAAGSAGTAHASDPTVATIVGVSSNADGSSQIKSEVIAECIQYLPDVADLQPVVDTRPMFLKAIGGDVDRNESVRTYSASIELTYVIKRKQIVIVTTNSVERSEPVIQEVEGRFDESMRFESDSNNGDQYYGRDITKYFYFSNEQSAVDDAMRRATAWLRQKQAVMCGP
jgi:hypothetical protein